MAKLNIQPPTKVFFSSNYHCIHSIQKLNSTFDTNVLAANISVGQLLKNRDILLVDDLKGDARWGMNKVIQRNISEKRVDEIKNEYLEANNRSIKFFPAITVVLLPKTNGEPKQYFERSETGFDNIMGVKVEKSYESGDYVYDYPVELCWDKNEISALVIDGQHRVSAIRKYYEGKNENNYQNISIPATFVLFKNDPDLDLIQATRALFIDVNNTPRLVSEEKLIFIDDRNIQRRISAKVFGSNGPGDDSEDVYQRMVQDDNFLFTDKNFINRYLIEESGKDEDDSRGFLSNHSTLFPWEISNIMTIHRNILGSILLKFKEEDKTRDIRSVCYQLNSGILDEIEDTQNINELSEDKVTIIIERLKTTGLIDSEIDVFNNLINIKRRNLEEVQQAKGDFFVGTSADPTDEKDLDEFISILKNIYNQDCTKDSVFELSANKVSHLLSSKGSIFVELLVYVYNNLWFTEEVKTSILEFEGEDRQLIFNFILSTHESLKLQGAVRRRTDKVQKQIRSFSKENDNVTAPRINLLKDWASKLEETQKRNLLRTVVGQEMLFLYIVSRNSKFHLIDVTETLSYINALGKIDFFSNSNLLELNFFDDAEFKVDNFNPWTEIIMKGETMKPGITNANKGADFIFFINECITNRDNGKSQLRRLERLQKSYGNEIVARITGDDDTKLFKLYLQIQNFDKKQLYLAPNEIEAVEECFTGGEFLSQRIRNIIIKTLGAIGLEQVIQYYYEQIKA